MGNFCSNCGIQARDGAQFCASCGHLMTRPPVIAQQYRQPYTQAVEVKKKKSKLPLILGIVIASAIVVVIAVVMLIGGAIGNWIKTASIDQQEPAIMHTNRQESPTMPTNQPEIGFAFTPEPALAIIYEPYVFDEAKAVPTSRLLEYYELNDMEMKLYEELLAGFQNIEPVFYLETPLDASNDEDLEMFRKVRSVLTAVHPEIFWLTLDMSWGNLVDGTPYVRPSYLIDSQNFGAQVDDRSFVLPTDEEITAAKAWVERQQSELSNILNELPVHSGMTPFELELAVYDWLCVNITYDNNVPNDNTVYGALIEKTAACEGYSKAFQHIMGLMGVESLMIYGMLDDGIHAWNAVKLDGQWYQVDVTSSSTSMRGTNVPCREYLNRTDEYMSYDHIWHDTGINRVNAPIVCTATEYNYFVMIGQQPITSDEDFIRTVPDIIARARVEGNPMFELEFDPAYATPGDIVMKKKLIDEGLYEDVVFHWSDQLVIGVFEDY